VAFSPLSFSSLFQCFFEDFFGLYLEIKILYYFNYTVACFLWPGLWQDIFHILDDLERKRHFLSGVSKKTNVRTCLWNCLLSLTLYERDFFRRSSVRSGKVQSKGLIIILLLWLTSVLDPEWSMSVAECGSYIFTFRIRTRIPTNFTNIFLELFMILLIWKWVDRIFKISKCQNKI